MTDAEFHNHVRKDTEKEFYKLVAQLRAKQKQYFATRSSVMLAECKDLERRVDAEIACWKRAEEMKKQPELF